MDTQLSGKQLRVSRVLESLGFGFSQVIIACFCGSYFCLEACILSMFAFLLPELSGMWNYSKFTESFVCSITFLGMFVGNNVWGYLSDSYGRKPIIVMSTILCIIFGVLGGLTITNYPILFIIVEFFNGIAVGGGVVAFSFFIEFLPQKNRGLWMLNIMFFWTFGSIIGCLMGYFFIKNGLMWEYKYNFFIVSSVITSFVTLLFVPFVPESLHYDLHRGNNDRIVETIKWIETWNCRELDKKQVNIIKAIATAKHEENNNNINNRKTEEDNEFSSIWDIFKSEKKVILMFVSICVFSVSGNVCYFGVALCSPRFFSYDNRFLGTLVLCVSEIPGIIFGALAMHYLSRKNAQGVTFLLSGISMVILLIPTSSGEEDDAYHFHMFFGFFGRASVMAASCITWVLAQESLPTKVRSTGVGFATSLGKLGVIIAPFLVQMMPGGNAMLPKSVFAILALFAAVLCYFYPLETRGKELDFSITKISLDEKDY